MRTSRLYLGALLLGLPLLGLAQAAPEPAGSHRFFVGLGAYSSYYQKLGTQAQAASSNRFQVPVQFTAGYQLAPRLALQASTAYSGHSRDFFVADYNSPSSPTGYSQTVGSIAVRTVSVAALARYTAFTSRSTRLQVDALGGLGLEYFGSRSCGTSSNSQSGLASGTYERRNATNILVATLGAGLRYRLKPRFELTYDFTVNRALVSDSRAFLDRSLTTSHGLGLRYRFGSR